MVTRVEAYDAWLASSTEVPKLLLTFDSSPTLMIGPELTAWCEANIASLEVVHVRAGRPPRAGGPAGGDRGGDRRMGHRACLKVFPNATGRLSARRGRARTVSVVGSRRVPELERLTGLLTEASR